MLHPGWALDVGLRGAPHDGGIRSGQDLVRALALGAKAALIGRPWVMALAAGGEAALTRMLALMKQDMRTALGLTGVPRARDVTREILQESNAALE